MNNRIEIFQNNSKTIGCYITGGLNLSEFTPYLTVKRKASDAEVILQKIGLVSDPSTTVTFELATADTSIAAGDYVYDVVIESSTQIYTVVKDRFSVLDGVKW